MTMMASLTSDVAFRYGRRSAASINFDDGPAIDVDVNDDPLVEGRIASVARIERKSAATTLHPEFLPRYRRLTLGIG